MAVPITAGSPLIVSLVSMATVVKPPGCIAVPEKSSSTPTITIVQPEVSALSRCEVPKV